MLIPFYPPLEIKEGVVLGPVLLFRVWTSIEIELTCKKIGPNLKNWMRFQDLRIWQNWDFCKFLNFLDRLTHNDKNKSRRWALYLKNWGSYMNFCESSWGKISFLPNFQISKSHSVFEIWTWFFVWEVQSLNSNLSHTPGLRGLSGMEWLARRLQSLKELPLVFFGYQLLSLMSCL